MYLSFFIVRLKTYFHVPLTSVWIPLIAVTVYRTIEEVMDELTDGRTEQKPEEVRVLGRALMERKEREEGFADRITQQQ